MRFELEQRDLLCLSLNMIKTNRVSGVKIDPQSVQINQINTNKWNCPQCYYRHARKLSFLQEICGIAFGLKADARDTFVWVYLGLFKIQNEYSIRQFL